MATRIKSARSKSPSVKKAAERAKRRPGLAIDENGTTARDAMPRLDPKRAFALVMELMAIPGASGHEGAVAEYVTKKLLAAGARADMIRSDNAHKKTPIAGEVGNLVLRLPGTARAARRLLMAHMDTVPICVGAKPVRKGEVVRSADPKTGLGADDRSGVAVVLNTAIEILERNLPHPPLTFLFAIQEEVGLHGARHVELPLLGKPRLAFNWDGGAAEKITTAATGGYRLQIEIEGLAAHAGAAPEMGVSAIAVASLAIAQLVRDGWHGLIEKGNKRGTSNVGVIQGGHATNVVTDHVELKAEARSHDKKFRKQIVDVIEKAFREAAAQVRNIHGKCGSVRFHGRQDYEAFRLADGDPSVVAAEAAVRAVGLVPCRATSNGGLDANWMTAHGIPTVTLGCGQMQIHTTSEFLDIGAFHHACQIALQLATDVRG
jgi:tripeptide aminopeptidase